MEQPTAARSVGLAGWWPQLFLTADPHELLLCEYKAAGQLAKELEHAGACKAPSLLGLAL